MPHVITQHCCNDAACVSACPVDCIHPRPDEPDYLTAEMLYIDPDVCVDCGACIQACPVDAIRPRDDLPVDKRQYLQINARYAADSPPRSPRPPAAATTRVGTRPLRVAIVGAGPAGMYAAEELLARTDLDVTVDVFDRLPTPGGLIRAGVAPDHALTKGADAFFRWTQQRPGFRFHLGVEIGRDLTHDDLAAHVDAVLYTHGASVGRRLGVPGEDLTGCLPGSDVVAWYNGHPDHGGEPVDLSSDRAVVIGNGNVALDIARILTADPDDLARSDIADTALAALRGSRVREVVVVGRRGPESAAYTAPELEALGRLRGVDVVVDPADVGPVRDGEPMKVGFARALAAGGTGAAERQIVLRFLRTPEAVLGEDGAVTGVRLGINERSGEGVRPTGDHEILDTRLVITAVGHRGVALGSLPFDEATGLVPNERGRVVAADGTTLPGVYVAGWIKRGPSGVIGTNKWCAAETVAALVEDHAAGRLPTPRSAAEFERLLDAAVPDRLDRAAWDAIDAAERAAGAEAGRPRVKLLTRDDLTAAARPAIHRPATNRPAIR